MTLRLLVQGWSGISHSFAVVNQWQLLALERRSDVELRFERLPLFQANWAKSPHPFEGSDRERLDRLPGPDGFAPEATYRIGFPFDFTLPQTGRLALFAVSESGSFHAPVLQQLAALGASGDAGRFVLVTPSRWSAACFEHAGLPGRLIRVVPHGVATDRFKPSPERDRIRASLGLDGFVFFHAGSMTTNKGVADLLRAFAVTAARHPQCRLLLKGNNALYPSQDLVNQALAGLSADAFAIVNSRLRFGANAVSMARMAELYAAADAYVSPYTAEGFNMPVLEAAACGLPVICTGGGATDDFVTGGFARTVASRLDETRIDGLYARHLRPDFDHLVALMSQAVTDTRWQESAQVEGPRHVAGGYTWDRVVDQLLGVLRE